MAVLEEEKDGGIQREWTYRQFSEIYLVINVPLLSTDLYPSSRVKGNARPGPTQELNAEVPPGRHELRAG